MRAKLANLNDCAVAFLSRAAVNLYWYNYTDNFTKIWCKETSKIKCCLANFCDPISRRIKRYFTFGICLFRIQLQLSLNIRQNMTSEETEQLVRHSGDVVSGYKNVNSDKKSIIICETPETIDVHEAIDRAGCGLGSILYAAGTFRFIFSDKL